MRARRGFEQNGVAGGQRMQCLHRGKKQRIIRRPNHKHDAKRLTLHFKRHAAHPERPAFFPTTPRCKNSRRTPFEPPAGIG